MSFRGSLADDRGISPARLIGLLSGQQVVRLSFLTPQRPAGFGMTTFAASQRMKTEAHLTTELKAWRLP